MKIKYLLQILCSLCCLSACGQSQEAKGRTAPNGTNIDIIVKDSTLNRVFDITDSCVRLYDSYADKLARRPSCVVYADEYAQFSALLATLPMDSLKAIYAKKGILRLRDIGISPSLSPKITHIRNNRLPLQNIRIAIDAGHIAGSLKEAESREARFMKVRPNPADSSKDLTFWEANLTLATAYYLKGLLENQGATVFLPRAAAGRNADSLTFEEWKATKMAAVLKEEVAQKRMTAKEVAYYKKQATDAQLFQNVFNTIDLRRRAEKINDFQPDMTVIVHYNAHQSDSKDRDRRGYTTPCAENYYMAFVAGGFGGYEISRIEDRLTFLRLLLSDDVGESLRLAGNICQAFGKMGIPPANPQKYPALKYLNSVCLPTPYAGVFSRNLYLTRNIRGTVFYGEPLCQNNLAEAKALAKQDFSFGNGAFATSLRVKAVAEAYFAGIMQYYGVAKP